MLVGVSGYARSGKDSVGQILCEEGLFTRIGFADTVKQGLYAINPWVPIEGERSGTPILGQKPKFEMRLRRLREIVDEFGWEVAKLNPEVRRLLQTYGTEGGRMIHGEDCWVEAALRVRESLGNPDTVITDCRFPNEATAIQERGGQVWRVTRPGIVLPESAHDSEAEVDRIVADVWITNDGTLDDLRVKVLECLAHYKEQYAATAGR